MSALDQRCITFEQSSRAALAYVTTKVVEDVIGMIYAAGSDKPVGGPIAVPGWTLELERKPKLRVVIKIGERKLLDMVKDVLRALGYTVNSMRDRTTESDYLVALV